MRILFILGVFMLGFYIRDFAYKYNLVNKAKAPKEYGGSNIEFIFGKPYAILSEEDYINNCEVWYEDKEG